ncbi:PRAME family member 5-like [Marmota monax]|nr:PRAME family member 5-like [Marmota monax]
MQTPEDEQQAPQMLQKWAGRSLLKDKSRAILALEDLPIQLFPPLFMEAFSGGHTEVLKKMVQAWPFTCLPLGSPMRKTELDMIRVALDGLDMLAAQQDRPSGWMRGRVLQLCCKKLQMCSLPIYSIKRILERLDLDFIQQADEEKDQLMDDITSQFAKMDSLQRLYLDGFFLLDGRLCQVLRFNRMSIRTIPTLQDLVIQNILRNKALPIPNLEYLPRVPTLQLYKEAIMGGHMEMVKKMVLSCPLPCLPVEYLLKTRDVKALKTLLNGLDLLISQNIYPRSQTPLKTLSLRGCPLKEKDLKHLSMCPSTDQLKYLDLSSFSMKYMSPEPFRVLLEKVAPTLETLVLEFCEITESLLNAISPALGHCSQVKTFSFCGNQIPLNALKNLLSHTGCLPLEQAKYPAPLESFDEILWGFWTEINHMKFDQVRKELMQLVKDIRPVHDIQIYTYDCVLHLKHTDFIAGNPVAIRKTGDY